MEVVVRATVVYLFLFVVARGTGKRELSEMTAFELILLVTMGDLVQQAVTQEDMSITGAFLAVGTLAFWSVVISYVSFRFRPARPALEGTPVIVLRDGEPLTEVLDLERLTLDELKEEARNQGIGHLRDIRMAVLEPDGRFSFLKRSSDDGGGREGSERHRA